MSALELYEDLVAAEEARARSGAGAACWRASAALEQRVAAHRSARRTSAGRLAVRRQTQDEPVKGLYVHGDVGRGKTMLMDLFFEASPVVRKRRAHFHEFMADVHERVRAFRQKLKDGEIEGEDADPARRRRDRRGKLAALLRRIPRHRHRRRHDPRPPVRRGCSSCGVVVVATSNVAPSELYKDGLNRALFLPFIAMIERHMEVIELKARTDFRLEKLAGQKVWYVPADDAATAALDEAWRRLVGSASGMPQELSVKGRRLRVPRAAMGVARFFFHDLCEQPLAAPDYLRIAHEFHTLIIDRIPVMGFDQRNAAKRFIILIDTLYDHAVKLVASAAAEPDALYEASDGFEAAEFKRTASRLIEMRSQTYLALPHGRRDSAGQRIERGDRRDVSAALTAA